METNPAEIPSRPIRRGTPSRFQSRFAPYPAYNMDCRQHLRKNGVTVISLTPGV